MICPKEECTGCFACYNICSKNAINMEEDENGCIYPVVDAIKCINCKLCNKVCVNNKEFIRLNSIKRCYAARVIDEEIYKTTSSGGVATQISMQMLEDNGVVYGASFKDNKMRHIRVTKPSELELLKGSKYVHSYIMDTYIQVKQDLNAEKKVLYTGTPCQIAGLKKFLIKEYDNLYTIDLICHGVPSQKYLAEELNKYIDINSISCINFRKNGKFTLNVIAGANQINKLSQESLYYSAFLKGIIYRENCYQCPFAQNDRVGDITLGDFWGLDIAKDVKFSHRKGINCVLINSDKGETLIQSIRSKLYIEERNIKEAIDGNTQLRHPTIRNEKREKFLKNYKKVGFRRAMMKSLGIKFLVLKYVYKFKSNIKRNEFIVSIYNKIKSSIGR